MILPEVNMAKKILFFYQSSEVSGGVDTVLINLIKTWPGKDDTLEVWLNKGHRGSHLYTPLGVVFKQIGLLTIDDLGSSSGYGFQLLLRKFLWRVWEYPYFLYSLIIFYVALKKDLPDVVFSHNGGYPGGSLSCSFVIAAKWAGVKKVFLVVHNNAVALKAPWGWLGWILDNLIDRSCSKILSVSASCAKQLQETRFPDAKKIDFIYNGITKRIDRSSLADKMKRLDLDDGCKVIGCIGDYEERKGHASLIRAFHQVQDEFPDSKLIIIGSKSSPHTVVLKRLIQELHLEEKILLTGYLDAAWEYIECFDIFVFPSISYESFGMVLLEAMLYKKPVVATHVGGVPEVLADAAIIVEPNAPQQIADAIKRLLNNKDLAKDIGEKGYARVIHEFRAEVMAEKYCHLTNE